MSWEEGNKWMCPVCTYANWPKALKCTICRVPRTTEVITEAAPPPLDQERDIYKMAPPLITECSGGSTQEEDTPPPPPQQQQQQQQPQPQPQQQQQPQQQVSSQQKWACLACTFLNWPRSTRCTQCRTLQASNKRELPESPTSPKERSLSPNQQQQQQSQVQHQQQQQQQHQQHQQEEDDSPTLRQELVFSPKERKYRHESHKWACHACTYENWPKSQKCVLCHQSRPRDSVSSRSPPPSDYDAGEAHHCRLSPVAQQIASGRPVDPLIPSSPPTTPPPALGSAATHLRLSPTASINNNNNNNNCNPTGVIHWRDKAEIQVSCSGASSPTSNNYLEERRLRQLARQGRKAREVDWLWLNACLGAVEGNPQPVLNFLSAGGDPTRQLTPAEVALLARPSAFDVGHTLVHLAIRFQHDELLSLLLSNTSVSPPVAKRVPSDISRHIAAEITKHLRSCLKQRKGDFHCYFATEFVTFALPAEIEDFPTAIQERLFDELLDRDVQRELEEESPLINWSIEVTERLGSRLYALWNRSAGDCLLDSALQATWGVFDRDNTLRRALGDSLCEAAPILYPRWKEAETLQLLQS